MSIPELIIVARGIGCADWLNLVHVLPFDLWDWRCFTENIQIGVGEGGSLNEGDSHLLALEVVDTDRNVSCTDKEVSFSPYYLYPVSKWTVLCMGNFTLTIENFQSGITTQNNTLTAKLHKLCFCILNLLLCRSHNVRPVGARITTYMVPRPCPSASLFCPQYLGHK